MSSMIFHFSRVRVWCPRVWGLGPGFGVSGFGLLGSRVPAGELEGAGRMGDDVTEAKAQVIGMDTLASVFARL